MQAASAWLVQTGRLPYEQADGRCTLLFHVSTNELNPPPDTSTDVAFAEGQQLAGCYALLRNMTVGQGPQVWLANDDVLGKDVTLHFLPAAVTKDSAALQELRQEIKRITGVEVREAAAEVETTTGTVVQVFTTGTVVQVFQMAHGVAAGTWSGTDPDVP